MKKTLSVLLVFGALTAAAEDSYLYWMIGDTDPYSSSDYNTVRVKATDAGGNVSYLKTRRSTGSAAACVGCRMVASILAATA